MIRSFGSGRTQLILGKASQHRPFWAPALTALTSQCRGLLELEGPKATSRQIKRIEKDRDSETARQHSRQCVSCFQWSATSNSSDAGLCPTWLEQDHGRRPKLVPWEMACLTDIGALAVTMFWARHIFSCIGRNVAPCQAQSPLPQFKEPVTTGWADPVSEGASICAWRSWFHHDIVRSKDIWSGFLLRGGHSIIGSKGLIPFCRAHRDFDWEAPPSATFFCSVGLLDPLSSFQAPGGPSRFGSSESRRKQRFSQAGAAFWRAQQKCNLRKLSHIRLRISNGSHSIWFGWIKTSLLWSPRVEASSMIRVASRREPPAPRE